MHLRNNWQRRLILFACSGVTATFLSNCASTSVMPAGIEAGKSYQVSQSGVSLYETPNASVFDNPDYLLDSGERVSVLGGNGREIEVELEDGVIGFIAPEVLDSGTSAAGSSTQPRSRREKPEAKKEEAPSPAPKKSAPAEKEETEKPKKKRGFFNRRGDKPAADPEPEAVADVKPREITPTPPKPPGGVLPLPEVRGSSENGGSSNSTPAPSEKRIPSPLPVDDVSTPAPEPSPAPVLPVPSTPPTPTAPSTELPALPTGDALPVPPPPVPQPPDLDDLQMEPID